MMPANHSREGKEADNSGSILPSKPRIPGKWVFYAILLFALLHAVFFFAQTFFSP
jgi:hypothetical protein